MQESNRQSGRIDSIDILKAFGMVLTIVGHAVTMEVFKAPIYAFHMPLFFIASGITYRFSRTRRELEIKTKKSARQLLLPLLGLYLVPKLGASILGRSPFQPNMWMLSLLMGSGPDVQLSQITIPAIGGLWFLYALFFIRLMGDALHLGLKNKWGGVAVLFSIVGVGVGHWIWLPFSFDVTLAALIFFAVGSYLSDHNIITKIINASFKHVSIWFLIGLIGLLSTWVITKNYLELATREYPLFPICYITAAAWTMVSLNVSNRLLKRNGFARQFKFIGRNTMLLFCIHNVDWLWGSLWDITAFPDPWNSLLRALLRVATDVTILYMFSMLWRKVRRRLD